VGQLFAALRVDAFDSLAAFTRRVDETVRRIRSLPAAAGVERVVLPGELEHERAAERAANGIPLPADAVAELARVAGLLGIGPPRPGMPAP
jgi:LDH2 family malate/lactate/ureidoglycolate dehydrogenase